jgi:integrase
MNAPQTTATNENLDYNDGHIRPLPNLKSGKQRWQADYVVNGDRKKTTVYSIDEGKEWIDATQKGVERSGSDYLKYTKRELTDFDMAVGKAGRRVSLSDAVDFWLHHHPENGERSTVEAFYDAYYADLLDVKKCSADHLKDVRRYCGKLVGAHGSLPLAEVTTEQLLVLIGEMNGVKDSTRKKARDTWRAFFNAGIDRKLLTNNPAKAVLNDFLSRTPSRQQKLDMQHTIGILTAEDTRKLFRQMEHDRPDLVVGLVLGFFAGIRTEEISRVFWNMIDLEAGEIHLPAQVTKNALSRRIPFESNAVEWLLKHPSPKKGRVLPGDTDKHTKQRFEKARLNTCRNADVTWVPNAARHSFGSYHARLKRNEYETFTAMGHSNIGTFRKHYQNTSITEAECKTYWGIRPSKAQQVITMETGT